MSDVICGIFPVSNCCLGCCGFGGGEGLESAPKAMVPGGRTCKWRSFVMDELLAHHWGAAFPNMMRSRFPTVHATSQRVRSKTTKAGNVIWRTSTARISVYYHLAEILRQKSTARSSLNLTSSQLIMWQKLCGGNPQ